MSAPKSCCRSNDIDPADPMDLAHQLDRLGPELSGYPVYLLLDMFTSAEVKTE